MKTTAEHNATAITADENRFGTGHPGERVQSGDRSSDLAPQGDALKPTPSKPTLRMAWDVLKEIIESIGTRPAEHGGPFGGPEGDVSVTRFQFDDTARRSGVTYSPDHEQLNRLFKKEWKPADIRLRGFVHSHPGFGNRPSHGDEDYAVRILQAIPDLGQLWLPIVNTIPDTGGFTLTPWVAAPKDGGVEILRGEIEVRDLPDRPAVSIAGVAHEVDLTGGVSLSEIRLSLPALPPRVKPEAPATQAEAPRRSLLRRLFGRRRATAPTTLTPLRSHRLPKYLRRSLRKGIGATFQRVEGAYDLSVMRESRIIAVGTGGAAEWLESLARAGVGQFILIDPDTVSETNLATQQTYRRDLGRAKVDCVAERLLDINPTAKVVALASSLDDLSDAEIERLAKAPVDDRSPRRTILAGLTDNFWAQARVNRLALQFGLPSLCAQVYREGRAAEVTYTFPGVTPACHRCILSKRYRHFVGKGGENDVTSHGTPIFATGRLNAIKGMVALALLHHGTSHPRWGSMLERLGSRNLAYVRMDPDLATTIGIRAFDDAFAGVARGQAFFDETIWRQQQPEGIDHEHGPCPDCGGAGDLRKAIGTLPVTALARPN